MDTALISFATSEYGNGHVTCMHLLKVSWTINANYMNSVSLDLLEPSQRPNINQHYSFASIRSQSRDLDFLEDFSRLLESGSKSSLGINKSAWNSNKFELNWVMIIELIVAILRNGSELRAQAFEEFPGDALLWCLGECCLHYLAFKTIWNWVPDKIC